MKTAIITLLSLVIAIATPAIAVPTEPGVAITIYNDNFALVKDRRDMSFEKGQNKMLFTGVASSIDPTTVSFQSLTNPDGVAILEQNYNYDLVNLDSLLKRYIDKDISLILKGSGSNAGGLAEGKLLSYIGNNIMLETDTGLSVISRDSIQNIDLSKLPGDLVTKPTLVWLANSASNSDHLCQVTYTTDNINWKADYIAVLNADDTALDMSGWVTIDNKSGAAYEDATIKLIAGDVRREKPRPRIRYDGPVYKMQAEVADASGFEEKAFMEYHLYTLGRKSTILNNQVKQIQLIDPAENVSAKKIFVYEVSNQSWTVKSQKVQTKIEFENTEENKLGIALPKGKIRVFKKDPADDSLEFVGEDTIDHTPRKEKLSLYIGDAFDVVPEMKVMDAKHTSSYDRLTREIELRNRKEEPVTIFVDEKVNKGYNLKISDASTSYEKIDAYTMRFKVDIPADSTAKITYTATITW